MKKIKRLLTTSFIFTLFVCCFASAYFTGRAETTSETANKYDITAVTTLNDGEEFAVAAGTKYTGNKAITYGETVAFGYKNADSTKQLRMAFGIGYYGFYFYYNPSDLITVMSCDMSSWTRKNNIVKISRDLFNDYNKIEMTLTEKDENSVRLEMTYDDGGERKSVGCDFAKAEASDGLFRFGDMNFDGNSVKSLLPAPVFGNGFSYSGENVAGENKYDGCSLSVVSREKAEAAGVPAGFESDTMLIASSAKSSFDMSFDFTSLNYKRKHVTGVSVRLYIEKNSADNASYPEVRIPGKNTDWILRHAVGTENTGKWITVDFPTEVIDDICTDGIIGKFVFCVRSNGVAKMFIDEIKVEMLPRDTVAPVIDASITSFKTTAGTYPTLDYIVITDDSGACDVAYEWSEGALDFNGRLQAGNHTCTITATDGWDNATSVVIHYSVEAETPTEKYRITFRREGFDDYTVEYSADTTIYVVEPSISEKRYYQASWGEYEFEYTSGQVVNAVYTPIIYTVTYMADGVKVGEVKYSIENYDFDEPAVPKKKGYKGEWEAHTFSFENITVNAVYTESAETDDSTTETQKKGCSSFLQNAPLALFALAAVGAFVLKRKKER
mgnify:CR=1 FL=1